jgi:prepilin peptidase CpaA
MTQTAPSWPLVWLLALTLCAAITDARGGLIPNWLTLPSLCAAPLVHGLMAGPGALGMSIGGALLCGLVPLLLFGLRAIGGGDVKLFSAIGAVAGIDLGLRTQLLSYGLCTLYALCLLAWRGALLATLGRSLALLATPFLPRARRAPPPVEAMTSVRLGGAIFAASVALAALGA